MLFSDSEDNLNMESARMEADELDTAVDAAPEDEAGAGDEMVAEDEDMAADEYVEGDDEEEGIVDEDDDVAGDVGGDLEETMNPAADVVDTSATGSDEGEAVTEDEDPVADGAVDASAPTAFDVEAEPPSAGDEAGE